MPKLTIPKPNSNPFNNYSQLRTIWSANYVEVATKATVEDLKDKKYQHTIFLIKEGNECVGITGYWGIHEDDTLVGLRWTGVVSKHRRKGLAKFAIEEVIKKIISDKDLNNANTLVEYLPDNEYGKSIKPFFDSLGFVEVGEAFFITEMYPEVTHKWRQLNKKFR